MPQHYIPTLSSAVEFMQNLRYDPKQEKKNCLKTV